MIEDAAALTGNAAPALNGRAVLVLCADNGVVAQGVSQTDAAVTRAVLEKSCCPPHQRLPHGSSGAVCRGAGRYGNCGRARGGVLPIIALPPAPAILPSDRP